MSPKAKKSKKSIHCPASSSSISCTSHDSSGGLVANEPLLPVRRPGRPPKDREKTIMSWIINCKIVEDRAAVCCVNDEKLAMKFGNIRRSCIICNCCNKSLSAEKFQDHAVGVVDRPYEHIIVIATNKSLLSCMDEAWKLPSEMVRHKGNLIKGVGEYNDTYDDACMICGDGGELMCCERENCHSTYHHRCMDMEDVPTSAWFCPYCVCKLCGNPARGLDIMCTCFQCEKKYHWVCDQDREPTDIDINSTPVRSDPTFPYCEKGCLEVYKKLGEMVGVSNKLDDHYTWTVIRRMEHGDFSAPRDFYIRMECHSKLAIAWSLMKDCFDPISDRHTNIDVIQSIVYNCHSNYTRLNFERFYTAVLEKDGEIISAASLRIHGTKLAEMPFIATNVIHRRKGMCRKLMSAIESALYFLGVKYLIIPSVRRKVKTWSEGYNFSHLNAELKEELMCYSTLTFHNSIRLQKVVQPPDNGQVARRLDIDLNQEATDEVE